MRKLIAAFTLILLFSCSRQIKSNYITISGFTQGTTYSITYESIDNSNYKNEIEVLLAEFDTSLSTYNQLSLITQINNNETTNTDCYFRKVFKKADEVYKSSNGSFDITVAPLVNAWGFGFKNKEEITDAKIDSILEFVGFQKVNLIDSTITKTDPRLMFDVNAIAQGYSVDVIANFLEEQEIQNYLVEIGGEVKTKGYNNKGKEWRIGIDKPIDNNNTPGENLQAIVSLSNKSLATSGNYRKFYERDGVKYSHTINPKTGYPVTHSLLSATVVANDCMTADAYATAFMVIGLEEASKLVEELPEIEAIFIYNDNSGNYKIKYSTNMKGITEEVK
jgi:FAD:protein FMN transferase